MKRRDFNALLGVAATLGVVAATECQQAVTTIIEEGRASHHNSADAQLRQLGESSIQLVVGSGMNDASCTAQRARRSLHLLDLVG